MKLQIFFIFQVFFFFTSISYGQEEYGDKDSIMVVINPNQLISTNSSETINLTIENSTFDTLLIINEFYLHGLQDNVLVFPIFYSPNIIVMKDKEITYFEGDGKLLVDYESFPKISVIPPNEMISIDLNISNFGELIANKDWDLLSWIRLAKMENVEAIIRADYPKVEAEFRNSLVFDKVIQVDAKYGSSSENNDSSKSDYFYIIEKAFNLRP